MQLLERAQVYNPAMLEFSELKALVAHCTEPSRESFYRHLYKMPADAPALSIASLEDWRKLPLLPKDALALMPLEQRSYLPLPELDHLRVSSGTSGKSPLFSPRTHVRGVDYRLHYHDFKNPFLAYLVPMMPHWHESFQKAHGLAPRVVAYDPRYPAASVRIAKEAGVDALSVFVFHMSAIGEEMKKIGHAERIRCIEIAGEVCSRAQYEYMRATFPNATILQSYASSEVEDVHIGIPCKAMTGEDPLAVYHPKETHFLEVLDPESGEIFEPRVGVQGDLIISTYPGEPASFPLIRYKIGDTVQIVSEKCPHGSFSFIVLGRTEYDFIKIPGGVLRADEIARVLRTMPERVSDIFELHCYEKSEARGGKALLEPVLHVEPRSEVDLPTLASHISELIRVSPVLTYAQGVALGRYAPLSCEKLTRNQAAKGKRIVRHAA